MRISSNIILAYRFSAKRVAGIVRKLWWEVPTDET